MQNSNSKAGTNAQQRTEDEVTTSSPNTAKPIVSYSEPIQNESFDEAACWAEYAKIMQEENEKDIENSKLVLSTIKPLVTEKYFEAINSFLNDEDHGIIGGLKIVENYLGEWQYEYQNEKDDFNYWNLLKGMYVNQSCGFSGDDFHGTLEIKIDEKSFLRCSFSL
jgi:hypothetical protein